MADEIRFNAVLTISPLEVYNLLKQAQTGLAPTFAPPPEATPIPIEKAVPQNAEKPKRGRPKKKRPEAEVAAPEAEEVFRLKVDLKAPFSDQVRSVIAQAAQHKHGDAITRRIVQSWSDDASKAVDILKTIFPAVTLETIAGAVMETSEGVLSTPPNLFLSEIFRGASLLAETAQQVTVTKCGICEQANGAHMPGCPAGVQRSEADGGAVPSRVPNAAIPAPKVEEPPEPCPLGGPGSGCPIPNHAVIRQGGAHVYVHPAETARAFREALRGTAPVPQWNAPQPPEVSPAPKAKRAPRKKK